MCVYGTNKIANQSTNLLYETFFYITKECLGLHMRSTTTHGCVCVCVIQYGSIYGVMFFSSMPYLFSRRSFFDFFFFKSPLTKKMRMGPNRIHLKRGRYEKKCTDFKLLFRSYSLGNKNILHVTRKLI